MVDDFPGNSRRQKEVTKEPIVLTPKEKKVQRITISDATRRKKPFGRKFAENFAGESANGVWSYVFLDVLVPAIKDMIADATSSGIERILFGESRGSSRRGRNYGPGNTGIISYNRMSVSGNRSRQREEPRTMSRRGRASHDFDEVILDSRAEAEEVLNALNELCTQYNQATVADLYDMVGIQPSFADNKWGWLEMGRSGVIRVRNGYLLDIPRPEPLD